VNPGEYCAIARTAPTCQTAPVTAFLDGSPPRAFTHRGWHVGEFAGLENTTAAFRRAIQAGYRYLETDVHVTADGQLVVFHDRRLDRVTDRTGVLADLEWRELRAARVGGREPIPLLSELLEEFPTARFNIDAKSDAAVVPLAQLIRETGTLGRVCLGSFIDRRLVELRRLLGPDVTTSMGSREIFQLVRASALRRPFRSPARAAQVPISFRGVPILTPRFIATAHAAGLEVHAWTIDDPAEMRRLLTLGVDGIMTDRPELLREVLVERGDWP
jgi:glycerophosphoryl diester phosphodiesterase